MGTRLLVLLVGLLGVVAGCEKDSKTDPQPEGTGSATPTVAAVEINIVYGSEKKAWLQDAITAFNASPAAKLDGKPIVVKGTPMGSGVIVSEVVDGKAQPDVWSPASDLFRALLNEAWTKKHGAAGGQKVVAPEGKRLVLTPLVIAMWKPMAQALGWPDKPIGWSDVLAMSIDTKGWQSKGHPEWGLFKFGHTHPKFSNSGLLSVVAEAYAAVGETRGLTKEKLANEKVARFMRDIEGSIVHYGESTGFFADKMLTRGPSYLSAAVIYENLVVDSYRRPEFKSRELDIVAVYPKEGTFWNDHPYIVLDAPWVTEPKRKAAKIFLDFLLSAAQQRRAMSEYGFRPADPAIAVSAPIDAAHGVDPKQPKTLLDTPEADVVNAALDLWMRTKKTVDIMFVFDRSGSMQGDPLVRAKQGAKEFLSHLDDRDRVALLPFNNLVPEAIEDPVELAKAREKMTQGVEGMFADGGTALYDAIAAAHKKLDGSAKKEPKRIYAMVVLSDGLDRDSRTSLEALEQQITVSEEATTPPVRLFTIAYGAEADPATLARIAERGGGASFKGDTASIGEIYRGLASFF